MSGEWTDDFYGQGLLDTPYVAVNGSVVTCWVGGVRFVRDNYWGQEKAIDTARRTGLPVFVAKRDWRRAKSIKWMEDNQ